jgi:hypothetical protein
MNSRALALVCSYKFLFLRGNQKKENEKGICIGFGSRFVFDKLCEQAKIR